MNDNRCFPSFILLIILIFSMTIAEGAERDQRDGSFWMALSKEEKHTWIDGYIAASAAAVTWSQISGIPDKSVVRLMSWLEIIEIMNKERDSRAIARHIDTIYSARKYYSIGLPMALQIVKDKLTRNDNLWQTKMEFYSLSDLSQDEFINKYYSGNRYFSDINPVEFRQKLDEYMKKQKR